MSQRIAPRANTSLLASGWRTSPAACSEGIYASVPRTDPVGVSALADWVNPMSVGGWPGDRLRVSVGSGVGSGVGQSFNQAPVHDLHLAVCPHHHVGRL